MAYVSQYPPAYSSTYVKATNYFPVQYEPQFSANPANRLTDSWQDVSWLYTNIQARWHIDLGAATIIKRIYYEGQHNSGANTDCSAKDFTFWGSNTSSAFDDVTYGSDTNWTQITTAASTFDQHVAANSADPKYILVTNTTGYRYYAIKISANWGGAYVGLRRIELQYDDTPVASTPCMMLLGVG